MPTLTRSSVETIDVNLRGLRIIRLSLASDPAGQPETLTLTPGWADPWRPCGEPMTLPATVLPDLRRALDALTATLEES